MKRTKKRQQKKNDKNRWPIHFFDIEAYAGPNENSDIYDVELREKIFESLLIPKELLTSSDW